MRLKALKSFIGQVTMTIDEVKEVTDEKLANALIRAGMAVEAEGKKEEAKVENKKNKKGKAKKELNDAVENEDATEPVEQPPEEESEPVEEIDEPKTDDGEVVEPIENEEAVEEPTEPVEEE